MQYGHGGFDFYKPTRYYDYQVGNGLWDTMRSFGKRFLPFLLSMAGDFARNTGQNVSSGSSWKDAAKSAIKPVAGAVVSKVGEELSEAASKITANRDEQKAPQ